MQSRYGSFSPMPVPVEGGWEGFLGERSPVGSPDPPYALPGSPSYLEVRGEGDAGLGGGEEGVDRVLDELDAWKERQRTAAFRPAQFAQELSAQLNFIQDR